MLRKLKHKIDISSIKQLFSFVKPYKGMFVFVTILAILFSGLGVLRVYLLKDIIDLYIIPKDYQGLITIICVMLCVLIAEISSEVSYLYYSNWIGQYVIKDIRNTLFKNIIHFKMQYYNRSSVGRLVTNAVNDMERIAEVFSSGVFEIFSDILKMIVVTIVMIYVDWRLAVIVLLVLPFILYATDWFQSSMRKAFSQVRTQVGNLNAFVQERLTGMKIIQLFVQEQAEYQKFKSINKAHEKAWLKNIWYNSIFFPIVELLTSITIGLIVWYGGLKAMEGSIQLGTIFMFIQLIQMFFKPLKQIADKFNTLQMGFIATQRVFQVINEHKNSSEIQEKKKPFVARDGVIEFKNVYFGYQPEQPILQGISFKVEKGQTIAIVGATGAGKSTIINLINRFYEIQEGSIIIDNQDISSVDLPSLRQNIGVVLQDVFLFADTIYNNITLKNPNITYQEVTQAAQEIDIHTFFEQLPDKYHYNVKERGAMLSAGQRQLIAFLRAYVHKPKILILDEATSSVDSHLEKLIQQATDKITQGRTSIIIAHRLATIQKADKIIVLDKGKIVEEGTHKELLQIPNGYYKNLYNIQFKENHT